MKAGLYNVRGEKIWLTELGWRITLNDLVMNIKNCVAEYERLSAVKKVAK